VTVTASEDVDVAGRVQRSWRGVLTGVPGRMALAVASGVVLQLSFPPRELWFLAPVAFAGLGVVLYGRRFRAGFGYGLLFAVTFFLWHLVWIEDFLGADFGSAPWLALSFVEGLYVALACACATVVQRLPAAPVWMAALWVGQETLRSSFPLNGFPWGRVAFGHPSGPFTSLASIGGAPLVSFAVTLCGFGLARVLLRIGRREVRVIPAVACAVVPVLAGLAVWPTVGVEPTRGEVTVAVVQGNAPDIGLGLLGARDRIRANHLATSERLVGEIAAGGIPEPDLVVWPETATDLGNQDPELDRLVDRFDAPTLIGALYTRPDGLSENSVFVWEPGRGAGSHYVKQELVPFAEYVPWRPVAAWFTPFLGRTRDMRWGTEPGVLTPGGIRVGLQICYEVAYDYVGRQTVERGAQLLVVPTNNAWYGPGEMTYQQLAMSRLRAVEHGRATVVAATSGVSAIVRPDGSVVRSSGLFTSEILVGTLPLRDTTTVASVVGPWPERVIVAAGVAALAMAAVSVGWRIRDRRRAA